ncbi:MAG: hypothetical protein IPG07_20005 [Crocinitomicaceae bacterium]|nr:hypothetical protein [Crocinitomicaceae bacterium]
MNDVYFAFGADNPTPVLISEEERSSIIFLTSLILLLLIPLWLVVKLAPIEFTTQLIDGLYHIELFD